MPDGCLAFVLLCPNSPVLGIAGSAIEKAFVLTTLREFEDALREHGLTSALSLLEVLRERDRAKRSIRPARRITGKKMTPEIARRILDMHEHTKMTQQEIAFQIGVNQGRVNEVIKRGKWLSDDPEAPEAVARDKAKARMRRQKESARSRPAPASKSGPKKAPATTQLMFGDF
jgi:hypothetical protein